MRRWMRRRFRMKAKRLVKVRRVPMVGGGGVDVGDGGGDAELRVRVLPRRRLGMRQMSLVWRLRLLVRLLLVRLLLVKRCVRRSGGRSRAMVAIAVSAVDASVGEEIGVEEIGVGAIVVAARLLVAARRSAGIRGWIRCGSGLRREVLGRAGRTMR